MDPAHGWALPFIEMCLAVYVCIPALDYAKTNSPAVFFPMRNKLIQSFLFASALTSCLRFAPNNLRSRVQTYS
jgi:hypothetical protein